MDLSSTASQIELMQQNSAGSFHLGSNSCTFSGDNIQNEPVLSLLQPLRLRKDGVDEICVLAELEERLPSEAARAAAMQQRMPIHSFMFDQHGLLLHANHAATRRWTEKGTQPTMIFCSVLACTLVVLW